MEERAKAPLEAVEKELQRLPDFDVFGDSNASQKKDSKRIIADLKEFLKSGESLEEDVWSYLEGTDRWLLSDYIP